MDVRSLQGDTIDAICYRTYGRTAGVTETVYAANHGLADLGPILPVGTLVHLPEPADAVHPHTDMIQLWT